MNNYTVNQQHRNAQYAHIKSQWSITEGEELACYLTANVHSWLSKDSYWGLHVPHGIPLQLGTSPQEKLELYMAKFVEDQGLWHGYPVAHWLSPFDKPPSAILKKWQDNGYINKAKLAKINRGKKCSL